MRLIPSSHRLELPRTRYLAMLGLLHDAWVSGGMGPYRLSVAMSEIDLDLRCGNGPIHRRLCGRRV
jgi:hypothetical protein